MNDPFALKDDVTTKRKKQQVMTVSREAGGAWRPEPTRERHQVVVDDVEPRALPRKELNEESNPEN